MSHRRHDPPLVIDTEKRSRSGRVTGQAFSRHAAAGLWAVALIFAVGSALDLAVLWILQANPAEPTWEFFAVATTVESLPRLVLGIAFALLSLHLSNSTFLLAYRLLGGLLIAIGLACLGLAGIAFLDFFTLRSAVPVAQQSALLHVAFKTVALGLLEGVVLLPVGRRCMRRPG